ncbi:MAG: hypothetical protein A2898_02985 [Candidatus Kerfeldbacteria bacterium RIFCSPLOWO2_01_FULL_48_11]|uniref:PEGA domain-containing protein n=1 Tax=Candidatus Kerfeldbacteria bacterium RIFCSPLOWO2_01_FULL_48_11 TaxID=1798543 RepID=A0A1G2BA46_9BACT|nr:MAG: hypothetical protein UY34_C0011G0002 [Parcubacteria group bacterium GW2011_GWA2_48_9]KKW16157.1 MAG: hypothetical protein UY52_C0009G0017 [Parcubacteria group bacterium GW2011_GWC2_49_9]OGY85067.1 MAG: hypothetical protein A2898_02985 [Candidatus Kerfeldbacteria bacterium RIFCSPLOWO2_01_FULL_48_11]HCJ52378.1 hypothetical protein [Candidatus Kerfeldbacteria bacterium]HCM68349.1 hypothetical protein [Candidatus Kerfeldbacteria bacterium]
MNARIRRLYLIATVLVFLITAPLLVSYSRGWRYDMDQHRIIQTGSFTVTSIPNSVDVRLNGSLINTTPIRSQRFTPGTYVLSLSKDGWISREQTITIQAGQATVVEDVVLIKDDPEPVRMLDGNIVMLESSPDYSRRIAVVETNEGFDLFFNEDPLGDFRLIRSVQNSPRDIRWSSDQTSALVTFEKENGQYPEYLVVSASRVEFIPEISGEKPRNVFWDTTRDSTLWLWVDHTLREFGTETEYVIPEKLTPILITQDVAYAIRTQDDAHTLIAYTLLSGDERTIDRVKASPIMTASLVGPYFTFSDPESHATSFMKKVGGQYVMIRDNERATRVSWSSDTEQLLLLDGYSITTLDDKHTDTLVRYSTGIQSASWLPNTSIILFLNEGDVYSLDLSQTPSIVGKLYDSDAHLFTNDKNGDYLFIADTSGILRLRLRS